jgi:hypothetical protein
MGQQMMKFAPLPLLLVAGFALGACDGVTPYTQSPNTVIATAHDTGTDKVPLIEGEAAVVYDPDGCQGWIMDDGLEGYSGRRSDPVSGLPVCNNLYPPGTVVGNYQTASAPIKDYVPSN